MYNKNRIKYQEIGRCEIVIPNDYKEGIIKAFKLKEYCKYNKKLKQRTTSFYYNDNLFKGELKKGNQLCIKFFEKGEEVNKQIVKYLVSYLNKGEKDVYQHIFNNLKIRNFTIKKEEFISSNDIYNEQKKLYSYKESDYLETFIYKDVMNENIKYANNERFFNYLETVDIAIKDIDKLSANNTGKEFDYYVKVGVDRLESTLECYQCESSRKRNLC